MWIRGVISICYNTILPYDWLAVILFCFVLFCHFRVGFMKMIIHMLIRGIYQLVQNVVRQISPNSVFIFGKFLFTLFIFNKFHFFQFHWISLVNCNKLFYRYYENKSKFKVFFRYRRNFCLFYIQFSKIFPDLLCVRVVRHFRYTFPMSLWVDKRYVMKQKKSSCAY